MKLSVNPINYVNPVCCVATVCQVRCMYWGHLGDFHRAISHSKWYKIVCVRYLACKFSQMKSINMFSMFLQSGVPRHFLRIESTMTTSMEDVSTGFLEKIKNIWKVKIKPKMIWCIKTYIIAYVKTKKIRYTIHYVKPTAQLVFKNRFPKGGPTCSRQVVYPWHQMLQGQSVAVWIYNLTVFMFMYVNVALKL